MNRRGFIGRFTGALAVLLARPKVLLGRAKEGWTATLEPGPTVLTTASQRGMIGTLELEVHNDHRGPKGKWLEMTNGEGHRSGMPLGPEITRAEMETEFSAEATSWVEWRVFYDEGKGRGEEKLTGVHHFDHDPEPFS